MHSAYSAVVVGSANSSLVVAAPLRNFQSSLSLVLSGLFLIRSTDLSAARHVCGAAGQTVVRHSSVASLQIAARVHGSVPPMHVADWQVSAPLQNSPSEHEVPSGCLASDGHESVDPSQVSAM